MRGLLCERNLIRTIQSRTRRTAGTCCLNLRSCWGSTTPATEAGSVARRRATTLTSPAEGRPVATILQRKPCQNSSGAHNKRRTSHDNSSRIRKLCDTKNSKFSPMKAPWGPSGIPHAHHPCGRARSHHPGDRRQGGPCQRSCVHPLHQEDGRRGEAAASCACWEQSSPALRKPSVRRFHTDSTGQTRTLRRFLYQPT